MNKPLVVISHNRLSETPMPYESDVQEQVLLIKDALILSGYKYEVRDIDFRFYDDIIAIKNSIRFLFLIW